MNISEATLYRWKQQYGALELSEVKELKALRRSLTEGSVDVRFIVGSDGLVLHAQVLKASHKEFEAPALAAVKRWRFKPATHRGVAVAVAIQMPIVFTLEEEKD